MKNSILRKRLEIFIKEIINQDENPPVKPINKPCINITNNITNNIFTDIFTDITNDLLLSTHKQLLKILVKNTQNKNWNSVYACLKMIWNLKSLRIEINLEKLEYLKRELKEDKKGYYLLNKMLKEKYFVIIEDYKEFEIELECNRLEEGV